MDGAGRNASDGAKLIGTVVLEALAPGTSPAAGGVLAPGTASPPRELPETPGIPYSQQTAYNLLAPAAGAGENRFEGSWQ